MHLRRDIWAPLIVGRERATPVVDAPAAVPGMVYHDVEGVVRDKGGHVAEGFVVLGKEVALRAQRVETGPQGRRLPDAPAWLVAARFLRRPPDTGDVELGLQRSEGLVAQQER